MKTLRYTLITLLATIALTSCTHNNGDIGIWFGTWQVEHLIRNNDEVPKSYYDPSVSALYFQFQGDVVTTRRTTPMHDEFVDYGTWSEDDGTLEISFPDPNIAYDHVLGTLLASGDNSFHFTITNRSASHVTLTYFNAIWNQQWTLKLRKQ